MATKIITNGRPITLNGSCHASERFCPGIEPCAIAWKELVQETLYRIERHIRKFIVQDDLQKFLVQIS